MESRQQIESKIADILSKHFGKKDLKLTDMIIEDLGGDSLDAVEIIMAIEQEYNVIIPDEDVVKIRTGYDAVKYVQEKLSLFD